MHDGYTLRNKVSERVPPEKPNLLLLKNRSLKEGLVKVLCKIKDLNNDLKNLFCKKGFFKD